MHIAIIRTDSHFDKNFKKLPKNIKLTALDKEAIFRADPFDPRLKTHKLHGKQKQEWAFSINHKYRITFLFESNVSVRFLDVGTHDDLYF